jgi:26S proteasome regulatory subunit N8
VILPLEFDLFVSIFFLQDVFNLLPNLNVNELIKAFAGYLASCPLYTIIIDICRIIYSSSLMFCFLGAVKTNDMMLVIYLSSLIRSVIALHNLINNKVCSFYIAVSIPCMHLIAFPVLLICAFGH